MKRYRNRGKNVIVEAVQLVEDNASEISNWANGAQIVEERDAISGTTQEGLNIKTPHGIKRLSQGMYLVKFQDEFYLAKPELFERVYEPLTPTPTVVPEHLRVAQEPKAPLKDPFEGMTRFGEGPKP